MPNGLVALVLAAGAELEPADPPVVPDVAQAARNPLAGSSAAAASEPRRSLAGAVPS